ncbi:hypothetical protein [Levilactobacillus bambusae]|uniref:Monooxygenase n=1 Tax=Levilactobacillus bambusae TaxID=2024736 RepID=A0A2V1N391_9LACO|nr:hypothetical protein [Levilactobacillus bambusae]PWG00615.1 hypothetical protein DCM90_00105 [Levilactobacillus bambusae]
MINQISVTFGTEPILKKLITQNPDRELLLLRSSTETEGLQLLDVSGEPTIFKNPTVFNVKIHSGENDWRGYFNFMYFNITGDDVKIFAAKVNALANNMPDGMIGLYGLADNSNTAKVCLLTLWESHKEFATWQRSDSYAKFSQFMQTNYHYFQSGYQFHALKETD